MPGVHTCMHTLTHSHTHPQRWTSPQIKLTTDVQINDKHRRGLESDLCRTVEEEKSGELCVSLGEGLDS